MRAAEQVFERLMALESVAHLDATQALRCIGELIDLSGHLGVNAGWVHALKLSDELEPRLSSAERATLHYFRSNAWAGRHALRLEESDRAQVWAWEQPEIEEQILYLRRAMREADFKTVQAERRCQMFVNLGNALSHIGRFVEALEYWKKALDIVPDFAMALGNRGMGLRNYARYLSNPHDVQLFAGSAQRDLDAALSQVPGRLGALHPAAKAAFEQCKSEADQLLAHVSGHLQPEPIRYPFGRSEGEQRYRRWCLANRLFLNPLNDLGQSCPSASDPLFLPSHRARLEDPPIFTSFFNQIKQEFVAARFLHYEGITSDRPHFADRRVRLLDTLVDRI